MKRTRNAFTLVEMLIVIAIISILAAMAISSFSNAAQDSREVVVRQQLAVVQEALSNWVAREVGKRPQPPATDGKAKSISDVRTEYNAATTASTRLAKFRAYLDDKTLEGLSANNTTGRLTTDAMAQTGYYLTLLDWSSSTTYPKVQLSP